MDSTAPYRRGFVEFLDGAIGFVARGPVGVEGLGEKRLAVFEGGLLDFVQRGHRMVRILGMRLTSRVNQRQPSFSRNA